MWFRPSPSSPILVGAAPAVAQTTQSSTAPTITATGSAQSRVEPKNRHSNASIALRQVQEVHRCFVPRFASSTLTVTYSASS
ncbi:MAG: hypothetical protein JO130_05585 [Solirubrobacterales bacterium]|nr:hypothetical protein [Solirubrobacterales bacterium]